MISAIIPAFNEEKTIAEVIKALKTHPKIKEIIVVNDGSTDKTEFVAKEHGAKVISLHTNAGKAEAMEEGVTVAKGDIIFFLDADIVGLTHDAIDLLTESVANNTYDMFVAIRERSTFIINRIIRFFPILSGIRVLKRDLWNRVPKIYKKAFQIEIALNYHSKIEGRKMSFALIPDLKHITKEEKYGFITGLVRRIKMYQDVLLISCKLYILNTCKLALGRAMKIIRDTLLK